MQNNNGPSRRSAQSGAITIMVALMLLVLLTIAAVGMSRNSFRSIVSSGFARQGAMAQNVADSGLEWSIYWMALGNSQVATNTGAREMATLKTTLLANDSMAGTAYDINGGGVYSPGSQTPQSDLTLPASASPANVTQGYTIGLTRMGKLPITGMSQGSGQGAFTPAAGGPVTQAPDLWAVRADAQVNYTQSHVTFTHAKEAWISTPVQ
jgi:hypothetical protein